MQTEKAKDLTLGLVVLAIAIGGFVFINPTGAAVTKGVGGLTWRTLPFIYSGLLLVFTLLFLGFTLFKGAQPVSEEGEAENELAAQAAEIDGPAPEEGPKLFGFDLADVRRVAVIALLIAYSQAIGAFGFALSTPVFLFAVLYVFGKMKPVENLLVSLIGGAVLWMLFSYLLHMPLTGSVWDPVTPGLNHALRAMGV